MEDEEIYITPVPFVDKGWDEIKKDENGVELSHFYPDATISYTMKNGNELHLLNESTFDLIIHGNVKKNYETGVYKMDSDGNILCASKDGKVFEYNLNANKKHTPFNDYYKIIYNDSDKIAYDENGNELFHIYPNGEISYKMQNNNDINLLNDTDYIYYPTNERGTYTVQEDGSIILTDKDGFQYKCDHYGKNKIDIINANRSYISNGNTEKMNINGNVSYHKLNHIEFDEYTYNKIMTKLMNISGNVKSNIDSSCSNIQSIVNGFDDYYSLDGIDSIKQNIDTYLNSINELSENINYSILAYSACDKELIDKANYIIDELFNNDEKLESRFKSIINDSIEDSNNNDIYTFKENTDFNKLSNELGEFSENYKTVKEVVDKYDYNRFGVNKGQMTDDLYLILTQIGTDYFNRVVNGLANMPKNYDKFVFETTKFEGNYSDYDINEKYLEYSDINTEKIPIHGKKIEFVQILPKGCTATEKLMFYFTKANVINTITSLPDSFANVVLNKNNPIVLTYNPLTQIHYEFNKNGNYIRDYNSKEIAPFVFDVGLSFTENEKITNYDVIYTMARKFAEVKDCVNITDKRNDPLLPIWLLFDDRLKWQILSGEWDKRAYDYFANKVATYFISSNGIPSEKHVKYQAYNGILSEKDMIKSLLGGDYRDAYKKYIDSL